MSEKMLKRVLWSAPRLQLRCGECSASSVRTTSKDMTTCDSCDRCPPLLTASSLPCCPCPCPGRSLWRGRAPVTGAPGRPRFAQRLSGAEFCHRQFRVALQAMLQPVRRLVCPQCARRENVRRSVACAFHVQPVIACASTPPLWLRSWQWNMMRWTARSRTPFLSHACALARLRLLLKVMPAEPDEMDCEVSTKLLAPRFRIRPLQRRVRTGLTAAADFQDDSRVKSLFHGNVRAWELRADNSGP